MKKPRLAIESDPCLDYSLAERITRALEGSHLHVFDAFGFMSVPAAIGDPFDETMSMSVELTLLTDGRRGWLVLAAAQDEYDVEVEIGELVGEFLEEVPGPLTCVVRAVAACSRLVGALEIARTPLEVEYERHFDGRSMVDHEPLLAAIRGCGWSVKDELEIRQDMNRSMSLVREESDPMLSAITGRNQK